MMKRKILILFTLLVFVNMAWAQSEQQRLKYLQEPMGDKTYRKRGLMDGNLVRTIFQNDGQLGTWPDRPSGEWPKGTGHNYIDGCTPIVTAKIKAPGNGQIVHPAITSYREEVNFDPVTGELWVVEPIPGYVSPSAEEPALSTKPKTWPSSWPRSLLHIDASWDGYWYGYFGKGVQNADLETFYAMDDSRVKKFYRPPYSYTPIAAYPERAGLGIREEVRGFQWSHVLAEDIIFFHYDIINLSDANYDTTYFGFYCDTGVGDLADNGQNMASYNRKVALAYAWDYNAYAPPDNWKTGYVGYAFLESPGNPWDGIDNDFDATKTDGTTWKNGSTFNPLMVDERRDDNIDNDEDWVPYTDLNHNGKWDPGEPLNDDLGKDGLGPDDPNYPGPDEGEGDGKPTHGEPNFDETDKDESDQIGLTSLVIERLSNKGPSAIWPKNDEVIWRKMNYGTFDTSLSRANIQILFGSGSFPLKRALRERFSVALVFGTDYDNMLFNKETVQAIYNANYNFSQPPLKATLTAIPGDKKVFLYWDDIAERSFDRFLRKHDFEGYLIYRSQEPEFNDIKVITDAQGQPKYWKPIAQFDLKDGIKGPDPIGINGAHFWRGSDTGLQHSFVDSTVRNGSTYYYALVAYDQGDPNYGSKGLIPTETTKIITQDFNGTIKFVDINCAVVKPNAAVAGYVPPQITGDLTKVTQGIGSGKANVLVLNPSAVQDGAIYKVNFSSSGTESKFRTSSYSLTRTINGTETTIFAKVDSSNIGAGKFTAPFDGLVMAVTNDTSGAIRSQGWVKGYSNVDLTVIPDKSSPAKNIAWPADYELEWLPEGQTNTTPFTHKPIQVKARNITRGADVQLEYFDNDHNDKFNLGDDLLIIEYIGTQYKLTWRIQYRIPSAPVYVTPKPGDIFRFTTSKPFYQGDYFQFSTKSAKVETAMAQNDLNRIAVVPNPYIAANAWEKRNLNYSGRGERRIDFIHLPQTCTVRIYTVSGQLIKTLEKDGGPQDGSLSWNLTTEDGMDLAYGLYIYHVDAPGIGSYIGKFAVIK